MTASFAPFSTAISVALDSAPPPGPINTVTELISSNMLPPCQSPSVSVV
jgi:hypothetical protein